MPMNAFQTITMAPHAGVPALAAVLSLLLCAPALCDETALRSAVVRSTEPAPFGGTLGWTFLHDGPGYTIHLTKLGVVDGAGDGLDASHRVGLWTLDGALLASATVPAGTAASLEDGYRYVPVGPVELMPGAYVVGAHYERSDPDATLSYLNAVPVVGPQLRLEFGVLGIGRYAVGPELAFPTNRTASPGEGQAPPVLLQPNFQYTTALAPEPWTGALALIGSALLVSRSVQSRHRRPPGAPVCPDGT